MFRVTQTSTMMLQNQHDDKENPKGALAYRKPSQVAGTKSRFGLQERQGLVGQKNALPEVKNIQESRPVFKRNALRDVQNIAELKSFKDGVGKQCPVKDTITGNQICVYDENVASRLHSMESVQSGVCNLPKKSSNNDCKNSHKVADIEADVRQSIIPSVKNSTQEQQIASISVQDETVSNQGQVQVSDDEHISEDVSSHSESNSDDEEISDGDIDVHTYKPLPRFLHDIDYMSEGDPSMLNEYVFDIYDYLRGLERSHAINRDFLSNQTEVTGHMRSKLVDWLVLAHHEFHLAQETLHLTVAIIDRYLQRVDTPKSQLQLVGVAALWIASKYEEVYTPGVADLVYLTADAYTTHEVRRMECNILTVLDFQLSIPVQVHFLRRFSKAAKADQYLYTIAKFLTELTIVPHNLAHFPASKIAAAAVCLSIALVRSQPDYRCLWTDTLVFHTKYTVTDFEDVVHELAREILNIKTTKLTAIKKKYATFKMMRASVFVERNLQIVEKIVALFSQKDKTEIQIQTPSSAAVIHT